MWGRIYPHVILLIFVNIFKASCEGTSSLSFVIDDTGSMGDDIDGVKRSVDKIMNIVFNEKSSVIKNMVLVTFNDPATRLWSVTTNRETFKRALNSVFVYGGGDCPEMSMQGLIVALENSLRGSYIYVFTDAAAKDYLKSEIVKEMCQRKQSQIVFVLTGYCNGVNEPGHRVYYDIAAACAGMVFHVQKNEVNQVLHTIEETIKGNKTVMTTVTAPAGVFTNIPFTIDDQTEYAIVSASGSSVTLSISGPWAAQEKIMWNNNAKVIKLHNPNPGRYVATVMGQTATSVVIVGRTDFLFSHGFSELEPKTKDDTAPQPIADAKVHLSISVTEPKHSVRIVSAEILQMDGKLITELPLTETSKDFYITSLFVAPSQMFKVAVKGIIKSNYKPIMRIAKIPVTPQKPPKKLPNKTKPTASIVEGTSIHVDYNSKVKLTCKVTAYPEPKIKWINSRGSTMKSLSSVVQYPYEFISYLEIPNATQRDKYVCYAVNDEGTDSKTIQVNVNDAFVAKSFPTGITKVLYGSEGTITCDIRSVVQMRIRWYYADETTGANGQIVASDKYSISEDGTQLKIKKMDLDLVGKYTCKASLIKDENVQTAFSTRVTVDGLVTPKLTGVAYTKVFKGKTAVLECKIVQGLPKPKITWYFNDETGSKFVPIAGSDNVLRIPNAGHKHAGLYKCVAQNVAGSDEHVTKLKYREYLSITTNHNIVYQGVEGDAFFKIPCVILGLPRPDITWRLNGSKVIQSNAKYSMDNGALIIRDPKVTDTNSYMCIGRNEDGVVFTTLKAYILQAPKLSGVADKKVTVGSPASIECTVVKGEPKPKITWQFMEKSGSKYTPIVGSDNVLRILSAENKHAGRYKCVAQNTAGSNEHVTTLTIQELPKITTSQSTVYQGVEGDAVLKIPCVATGVPKPVNSWKLNGRAIKPNAKYSIEDGALIVRDPKVSDTNSYTCEAKNEVASVTATFKTYILQYPKLSGVADKKVTVGSPASIECTVVKGEPKPKITWQFMEKSGSKYTPIAGSENVLHISSADNKHAGRYKCVAQNTAGSNEHVTTLTIQELPKITTSQSTVYQGVEGDAVLKIPCVATGVPKPVISWKLNGGAIKPNAKYSIEDGALIVRDPKVSDTNSYTCEAKNEVASVTATFKTYILQAPKISGAADKKVRMGTPASIECTVVKGEPKPKITWQFTDKSGSKYTPIAGSESVLRISSAENKHAGRYKCVAQNTVGSNEHVTTLTVESPPRIITKSSTVFEGLEGDVALRIPCEVDGVPKPAITWKVNGTVITPNDKYSIEDEALVIMKPTTKDSNTKYSCEAKNYIGSDTATFDATIEKNIDSYGNIHHVYLQEGKTKKLECEAYNGFESQSVRWFIGGVDMNVKKPYMTIEDATVDNDGNYTCRVSDKHGHAETHTYVVDVGHLPRLGELNSLKDWHGEVDDILSNCRNDAKPEADIEWKFNGKLITEENLMDPRNTFKWGLYSCNVSNIHGSVQRTFDVKSSSCLISRNLEEDTNMPLLLTDEKTWPKWAYSKHYLIVKQEEKITVSCPNSKGVPNTFQKFPKQSELKAHCDKQDTFLVDGKFYKLSDLQCNNGVYPSIVRTKVKCSTETSELIRVGYEVSGFLEAYEVCFEHAYNMPLYSRVLMTKTAGSLSSAHHWYKYPGIGDSKGDRGLTCKDSSSSCCYGKSQLVDARDFNYAPAKYSTFIDPLNAIPYWRPCDKKEKTSWEDIDGMVRIQLNTYDQFVAWSGIHTLQEKDGAVIPRYLWKVLRFDDEQSVAIVQVNGPSSPTDKDIKCDTEACPIDEDSWFTPNGNATYCCELNDFLDAFDMHGTVVGESLDAAYGKIKSRT